MKHQLILTAILTIFAFTTCKKETITKTVEVVPDPTLAGEWYGVYGTSTSIPTYPYYFNIRSNMTMKIAATDTTTTYVADSTYYIVPGDSIKCTYTYRLNGMPAGTYTIAAKANKNFSFMSGTWGSGTSAYNGGSFFMGRRQK